MPCKIHVRTCLFDLRKKTPGLDDVESKVLLRTVNSSSVPEFGSGPSEEQLPLMVFVLSRKANVWDNKQNSTVVAHVVA